MRKYLSFSLSFLLASSFFLTQAAPAFACSCMEQPDPKKALEESRAVFAGRVSKISASTLDNAAGTVNIAFDVSKSWKAVDTPTLTIETAKDSAGCGYSFEAGKDYLVYTTGDTLGTATASLCSRTTLLASASADLNVLGEGTVIPQTPPADEPFLTEKGFMMITLGLMSAVIAIPVVLALIWPLISKKKSA